MEPVNYIAIVAATIAAFAVGAVWYSVLFQKQWMNLMGFTKENMGKMPLSPAQAMGLGFITTLIMVYVLAIFVSPASDVQRALSMTFWLWLGFMATVHIGSFLWEGKSIKLFLINASQTLVALIIATLILTLWPW